MKIFLILLSIILNVNAQTIYRSDGTSIEILGQSGKASISRGDQVVTMQVDYLSEVDSSGNEVGKTGSTKHSINSFATQDFVFTPLVIKNYQDISSTEFTFETPIKNVGDLKIVTIILGDEGNVGTQTEKWSVSTGDIKWNIELSKWSFCNPCADGTAKYIDIGIEIKGTKSESKGNKTVDLGSATLELSNKVVVDGSEVFMENGYPRVETKGSKRLYVFRIPKFTTKATYDPLLQMNNDSSNSVTLKHKMVSMLLAILTFLINN